MNAIRIGRVYAPSRSSKSVRRVCCPFAFATRFVLYVLYQVTRTVKRCAVVPAVMHAVDTRRKGVINERQLGVSMLFGRGLQLEGGLTRWYGSGSKKTTYSFVMTALNPWTVRQPPRSLGEITR